ncbi:MAG TPA: sugar ABC transporter permease [Spirochaeta sp.]|nr:sugar ABC transporter permease [Spirochaeta sp.]
MNISCRQEDVKMMKRFSSLKKIRVTDPSVFVWVLLIAIIIFSIFASPMFIRARNLRNVFLIQPVGLGIASLGQAVIIISGGIDMSIGAAVSFLTSIAGGLYRDFPEIGVLPVMLIIAALGLLIGLVNGLLVVKLRIAPFMATLATMSVIQGGIFIYTKKTIGGIPKSFRFIAEGSIGPVPVCFLYFALIFVLVLILLNRARYGRHLYAVGANEWVSSITGIAVERVKLSAYLLGGLLTGLASIFLAGRMGGGGPLVGKGYELDTITAVVIGGVSLAGGEGNVAGAVGGVLILAIFSNLMNLLDVNPYIQMLLKGLILITAVFFYSTKSTKAESQSV